jgi:hypothetical protein
LIHLYVSIKKHKRFANMLYHMVVLCLCSHNWCYNHHLLHLDESHFQSVPSSSPSSNLFSPCNATCMILSMWSNQHHFACNLLMINLAFFNIYNGLFKAFFNGFLFGCDFSLVHVNDWTNFAATCYELVRHNLCQ